MKHKSANISYEGQGWNPYALIEEGRDAFKKRVVEEGHYLRDSEGMGYSEAEREEIAGKVFDKAESFVSKEQEKKAAKEAKEQSEDQEQAKESAPATEGGKRSRSKANENSSETEIK